jgi:hypothetical protein
MRPRPWFGRWSTYTVLGLVGYAVAAIVVGAIGAATAASLAERIVAIVVPPFGFWMTIAIERRFRGVETIVFYHTAIGAWGLTCAVAFAASARVAVASDLVVVLVAAFLAFGRVGCFHVACCHGRPARFGVRYTHAHAVLGFPRRLVGRTVVPVQLIEAAASALLAITAVVAILTRQPQGTATCMFVAGYAAARFVLEMLRGDTARPYLAGLSEAQWIALVTSIAVALVVRSLPYTVVALALAFTTIARILRRPTLTAALRDPHHVDELERVLRMLALHREAAPVTTRAGLRVSVRQLPSGPLDVLWSHDRLCEQDVHALVRELAVAAEVHPARRAGMYHVLVSTEQ